MFGIRLVLNDGSVKYATSTRGYPSYSDSLKAIAIFAQQASAEKTIKRIRKDGLEKDGTLGVIELNFHIENAIDVPYPPQKRGWVIGFDGKYFAGYLTGDAGYWGNPHKTNWKNSTLYASVFRTEALAKLRLDSILSEIDIYATRYEKESADILAKIGYGKTYGYGPDRDKQVRSDRALETAKSSREWASKLQSAVVIAVG